MAIPTSFSITQTAKTARPDLIDPAVAGLQELFESIGVAFDDLMARGREQDAQELGQAAEKFAAIGSKMGVNSMTRARALTKLKNSMNIASRFAESKILAQKLTSQANLLGKIASLRGEAFDQATIRAGFTEEGLQRESQRVLTPRASATASAAAPGRARSPLRPAQVFNPLNGQLAREAEARAVAGVEEQNRIADRAQFLRQTPIRGPFGFQSRDVLGAGVPTSWTQATHDVRFGGMGAPRPGGTFTAQHRGGVQSPITAAAATSPVAGRMGPPTAADVVGAGGTVSGTRREPSRLGGTVSPVGPSPTAPQGTLGFQKAVTPSGARVGTLTNPTTGATKGRLTIQPKKKKPIQGTSDFLKRFSTLPISFLR